MAEVGLSVYDDGENVIAVIYIFLVHFTTFLLTDDHEQTNGGECFNMDAEENLAGQKQCNTCSNT